MQPIVTLISDWKLRDPYVAMLKGQLWTSIPDINILDITHAVDFFNISQTAFLMKQSYKSFPEGSIHLLLTTFPQTPNCNPVVAQFDNHYFVGEDNGIFCLMFGSDNGIVGQQFAETGSNLSPIDKIIMLSKSILDKSLANITIEYRQFKKMFVEEPYHSKSNHQIEGEIVFIDAFCNAVTNIPIEMFKEIVANSDFNATVTSKSEWKIQHYHENYCTDDEIFFTNNSLGFLEIAMFHGNVAVLTDIQVGDKLRITY